MDKKEKNLLDNHEEGFILNESGTTVPADRTEEKRDVNAETGSKSDPQLTELDGLKKGGVDPHVHESDLPQKDKSEGR